MKRVLSLCLFALLFVPNLLHAQQTKSPQMIKLFRQVVATPSKSTVRVLVDGKEAALGTVVAADGWILSKHSVLKGDKITCQLPDGKELEAELIGFDVPSDLAMLKIDANHLRPVEWTPSQVSRVGHWVASVGFGEEPAAI